jgi:NhaA family Na+:H+ antiporter
MTENLTKKFINFFKLETSSGITLLSVTLISLILSNTGFYPTYKEILTIPIIIKIGNFIIDKPILLWINDGLMAIFFCAITIEIKQKFLYSPTSDYKELFSQIKLPAIGALGGVLVPALIYVAVNIFTPELLRGWAIPTATDIAFSLAILSLFGNRIPLYLKLFLVALAVIDDLSTILVIALFYTSKLSISALLLALAGSAILLILNRCKTSYTIAYVWVGVFLWICMIKSGVHATLTGVVVGLALPRSAKEGHSHSPLMLIEHELKYWVPYFILPVFIFANAGVPLGEISFGKLLEPLSLGIALGLAVGKPLGVGGFVYAAHKMKMVILPDDFNWKLFSGVIFLTGIGFTMSLFVGTLAFEEEKIRSIRIGVLVGSFISALIGYILLFIFTRSVSRESDNRIIT